MFKIGQRIICVNCGLNTYITKGMFYSVVNTELGFVYIKGDDLEHRWYRETRFSLYKVNKKIEFINGICLKNEIK